MKSLFKIAVAAAALWASTASASPKPEAASGADGVKLAVYEWGDPSGPEILFIHGWSQSHLSWEKQYSDPALRRFRMVAIDLRGHGASDKPATPESYSESRRWADDVAAVIAAKRLKKPVLVGWSYGGFIMSDYLRFYGDSGLAGVNFVNAVTEIGVPGVEKFYGAATAVDLPKMTGGDIEANIAGSISFLSNCFTAPLPTAEFQKALAYNMLASAQRRAAMLKREVSNMDVLAKVKVPVLVSHGSADKIVALAAAENTTQATPGAKKSVYDGLGHAVFIEDSARFNRELAAFVDSAQTR